MKPTIYIEPSIPSFYYEDRTNAACVARREWTQQWWGNAKNRYELLTSVAVIEELEAGHYPKKERCVALMNGLPFVSVEPTIVEIVEAYVTHKVMPNGPAGNALIWRWPRTITVIFC